MWLGYHTMVVSFSEFKFLKILTKIDGTKQNPYQSSLLVIVVFLT